MNKSNIITGVKLLILGVITTYGVAITDALRRNSLFGEGGLPLRFTSGTTFLGEVNTEILPLSIDILFWTIILFGIWKFILKK